MASNYSKTTGLLTYSALTISAGKFGLTDANNRYEHFEAIRDVCDPTLIKSKPYSKALSPSDYLFDGIVIDKTYECQSRLDTLKDKIARLQNDQNKEKAENDKRQHFVRGLLGG